LKSQQFDDSQIFAIEANELQLSDQALLELMNKALAEGVPFRFRAGGWSMSPFIRNGDIITVSPLRTNQPGVGEIVAFIRPNEKRLVVHRVVGRGNEALIIRGDGIAERNGELVSPENILGRVIRIERNGHSVWLGLGLERFIIAFFSRVGLLIPLRKCLVSWLRPLIRR
jgi:signal peptidase I